MTEVKEGCRIVFIGDSITDVKFNRQHHRAGAKIGGKRNYPVQVAEELKRAGHKFTAYYRAIASNRSYHVYDRLTKDCIALKPDLIVMLIGVNDAWENYVPQDYPPLTRPFEPHMREIFRRIDAELPEAKLIVMTPFLIDTVESKLPFHNVLDRYIAKELELARGHADEIIELQKVFDEAQRTVDPYTLARDGVHPTELGHSYIARELLGRIRFS